MKNRSFESNEQAEEIQNNRLMLLNQFMKEMPLATLLMQPCAHMFSNISFILFWIGL